MFYVHTLRFKTAIWLFLGQGLAFLMKAGWQPWEEPAAVS